MEEKVLLNKKLIALSIILVSLLVVSAVSAAENLTDNADDTTEVKVDDKLSDASNELNDEYGEGYEIDEDWSKIKASVNNYKKNYHYGDSVEIKITNDNRPLKNENIDLELEGSADFAPFWGTTNSKGIFKFKLGEIRPGNYKIHVSIGDTDFYMGKTLKIAKYDVKISAMNCKGTTVSSILKAVVKDKNGKRVNFGSVKFKINGKTYSANVINGMAKKKIKLVDAKTYTYKVYPYSQLTGRTSSSKIVVKQSVVKVTTKNAKTNVIKPVILKAIVKKSNGKSIDEGYVKFKINGKTFKVNVNNGVAKKKITLSKAKTYYYTAKYVSKYYKSEPSTSKVVVNNVIVKKGKYVFALTASQYKKIKYIKNHRHPDHPLDLYFKTKTNQYYNNQLPIYVFFYSYYGRLYGELTNLVRYQYIAMPNNNPQDWIYISGKMVF